MIHPISIFEDADEYNYSKKYSSSNFYKSVNYSDGSSYTDYRSDTFKEIEDINSSVTRRKISLKHPLWAVPLTFLSIRKNLYDQLNGFDDKFFAGGENIDFVLRAL